MASSTEKLAKGLKTEDCKHINNFMTDNKILGKIINRKDGDEVFKLLSRKSIFPYEFIDNVDKLNYNKIIRFENVHSSLNDEHISMRDYLKYVLVWRTLKEKLLGNYSDLYNIQDVLLLADIFENFRDVCMKNFKLDPAHYLTSPSLAWDAMLKLTKINLELIDGHDMYLMTGKGIRGIKRYSKLIINI